MFEAKQISNTTTNIMVLIKKNIGIQRMLVVDNDNDVNKKVRYERSDIFACSCTIRQAVVMKSDSFLSPFKQVSQEILNVLQ